MKVVQCHLVRLFALLYLWASCAVVWHAHDPVPDEKCTEQHTHGHDHHHEEEDCSICFFIHNGTAEVPLAQTHFFIAEKPFFIHWNEKADLTYDYLYIHFPSNKDPPAIV